MGAEPDRSRQPVHVALAEALDGALHGSGRLVLLTGDAGIGKTTLARELADHGRRAAASVRWAACWPGGATVAHGPWLTVLAGLGPGARAALDALAGTAPEDSAAAASLRASAYAAVVAALADAAGSAPLVVVLDDLHWADEGSVQLLTAVAGQLPGLGVLVVGTFRDTEVPAAAALRRLGASGDRLELAGLAPAEVAGVLAASIGPGRGAELAEAVTARTGGNPFLVVQLARLLAADPDALARSALPSGARDLLAGRLAALSAPERRVLVAGAVLGSRFRAADLAALCAGADVPEATVSAALDRAAALRIVERSPGVGVWGFVHDLFRQAATDGVASADLAALHARAAAVRAAADAEPALVAEHLMAAGPARAVDAASWFVRAGERALAAFAWEEAATQFERALAALPARGPAGAVHVAALLGLGRARLLAGDANGAGRAFEQLAAAGRATGETAWLVEAALGFSSDLAGFEVRLFDQRQIDLLEAAAGALAADGPPAVRSGVLARWSVALSLTASTDRRLALAEEAVALARTSGDAVALGRALAAHCDAIAGPAFVAERAAAAGEIIALARATGDGALELLGRRLRFVARLEAGDAFGADEDAQAFERRAAALGNPLYSWYPELWRAQRLLAAGGLAGAEAARARAFDVGRAAGSVNAAVLTMLPLLLMDWRRGDPARSIERLAELAVQAPELAVHLSSVGAFARAYALAGRQDEAWAHLDRLGGGLEQLARDAEWLPELTNTLEAAVLVHHPLASEALAALEPYAALVSFEGIGAGIHGVVARSLAIGCLALGRTDDAVAYARQALPISARLGAVLGADAERTLAETLDRRDGPGDRAEAATRHAAADRAYAAAGLDHLVRAGATAAPTGAPPVPLVSTGPPVPARAAVPAGELVHDGDVWRATWAGTTVIVRPVKGLTDLARLLAAAGREVHVAELVGADPAVFGGDAGEALDGRAIAAYRDRLLELAEEVDDAEAAHDLARAERAHAEHDALVEQLAGAVGLAGRRRRAGPDPVERARKAVTARLRDAIGRLERVHPALGRHLAVSIRTGTYCSYQPEQPVVWRCQP